MRIEDQSRQPAFEMLYQMGSKWAVLTAMSVDMGRKGLTVPYDLGIELRVARMKIGSGCFSPCEVNCTLARLEGQLVSIGSAQGASWTGQWLELLSRAARGEIVPEDVQRIPLLEPVESECGFLERCRCGTA